MNPHKKLIDDGMGTMVENQRYLDYELGRKEAFNEADSIIKTLLKEVERSSDYIIRLIGGPKGME